jgi:hypothetical protein
MYLKIAIMNNSGNVGKSMICDTLLYPRIPNAEKIKIETINSDGTNDINIGAKDIKKLTELIFDKDIAIIDVGSSNIEMFMANLIKSDDIHEEIDFFFIPTTPKGKQQVDTVATIEALLDLGIEPERIKIIFNFYDPDFPVDKLYSHIFESDIFDILKLKDIDNVFTIEESPAFDMLAEIGISFTDMANDERDFKALTRATKDKKKRMNYIHLRAASGFSKKYVKKLDLTFNRLNKSCNLAQDTATEL